MTSNINVQSFQDMRSPIDIVSHLPITAEIENNIRIWRQEISNILNKQDKRLIVVVGPCSIHDPNMALDYARQLKVLSDKFSDRLRIVMRVYFEKPRTTVGWTGLINDPYLDGSYKINEGLFTARKLLLEINKIGLPVGCEFLDVFTPQYYADLVSWGAIGARTTESQLHRQLASGLSMPIGFKNGTGGSIDIARDALISASSPHVFLGINNLGYSCRISTNGNKNVHIILRGSKHAPNYYPEKVQEACEILQQKGLQPKVMIDMSHGNSRKIHMNQLVVGQSVCNQISNGSNNIIGVMIESNIKEGNQKLTNVSELKYGVSITDACININTTLNLLQELHKSLGIRLTKKRCMETNL